MEKNIEIERMFPVKNESETIDDKKQQEAPISSAFDIARSQLELQKNIQEGKANIMGRTSARQQEIYDRVFARVEELAKSKEGGQNEKVIRNLAVELDLDPREAIREFNLGLKYNIRAACRLGIIEQAPSQESLDAVIGAYVLNFRNSLNYFKKHDGSDLAKTPKNIFEISKIAFLLSPKIVNHLKQQYQENPDVEKWMIKKFIINNPRDPQGAIEKYIEDLAELRIIYGNNPDVSDVMLKKFAAKKPVDPKAALAKALENIKKLRQEYENNPEIEDWIIKIVVFDYSNPKDAIEAALKKIGDFKIEYKDNPDVDEWAIKHMVFWRKDPKGAIESYLKNIANLREIYDVVPEITDSMIKRFAIQSPENCRDNLQKALVTINELRVKYKNNPEIENWMIGEAVTSNSNPEEAIEKALISIFDMKEKYKDSLDIEESMIKQFVFRNKDPEAAIETYLGNVDQLRKIYANNPDVSDSMIKRFALTNSDPKASLEKALQSINDLKEYFKDSSEIDEWMIRSAVMFHANPKGVLEKAKKSIHDLLEEYGDNLDADDSMIKMVVIKNKQAESDVENKTYKNIVDNILRKVGELRKRYEGNDCIDNYMIKNAALTHDDPGAYLELVSIQVNSLKEIFKDNPYISTSVVKQFVIGSKEPREAIEKAFIKFKKLKQEFADNPEVKDWMIMGGVIHYPSDPKAGIERWMRLRGKGTILD